MVIIISLLVTLLIQALSMQNYNIILAVKDISESSGPVDEPVSLAEMKDYLRLEGIGGEEFDFDDTLIMEFLTTSRQTLEETLGVSIVGHDWEASGLTNTAGNSQLPYGPVNEVTAVLNEDDTAYDTDSIKVRGDYLKTPTACNMVVRYQAGFEIVPSPLVIEIKRMVAYMYENRGEVDGLDGYKYSSGAMKYNRKSWLQ